MVVAAAAVLVPVLALAGNAASTRDLVLDFERSGVLKDLLGKTLAIARSFLFLSTFLAYFIEAFGRSPLAGRDYATVTWRVLVVLLLLWNYQAVFGGVLGLLDGLEREVAPASTWKNVATKNGRVLASWDLGDEYAVTDADGTRPHFLRWLQANMPEVAARWRKLDDAFYAYWGPMPYEMPG
jgi:hypothetical protein